MISSSYKPASVWPHLIKSISIRLCAALTWQPHRLWWKWLQVTITNLHSDGIHVCRWILLLPACLLISRVILSSSPAVRITPESTSCFSVHWLLLLFLINSRLCYQCLGIVAVFLDQSENSAIAFILKVLLEDRSSVLTSKDTNSLPAAPR